MYHKICILTNFTVCISRAPEGKLVAVTIDMSGVVEPQATTKETTNMATQEFRLELKFKAQLK